MKFTDDRAMSALRSVVARYGPHYVTPDGAYSCKFWDAENNRPSCILGATLTELGISKKELIVEDGYDNAFGETRFGYEGDYFSRAVVSAFSEAQWYQDCGRTWGDSLFWAEEKYKSLTRVAR